MGSPSTLYGNGHCNNDMNVDNENEELSAPDFFLKLCKIHKDDICELSHENGYPLTDTNKFFKWNLRSSLIKLIRIPSDSKLSELLSLRLKNTKKIKNELDDGDAYCQSLYYYLNIQINDKECIHVRIFSKNGKRELQAILYKNVGDKLRQF